MLDMNEDKSKPDNSPQGKFLLWFSGLRTSLRAAWIKHVRGGQGLGRGYDAQGMGGINDYHIGNEGDDDGGGGGGSNNRDGDDQEMSLSSMNDGNGSGSSGSGGMRRPRVSHLDDDMKQSPTPQHALQSANASVDVNVNVNVKLFQGSFPNRKEEVDSGGGSGGGGIGGQSGIHSPSPKGMH